jgi:hypothetical protein
VYPIGFTYATQAPTWPCSSTSSSDLGGAALSGPGEGGLHSPAAAQLASEIWLPLRPAQFGLGGAPEAVSVRLTAPPKLGGPWPPGGPPLGEASIVPAAP